MRVSGYEMVFPLIGADEKVVEGKSLLLNGLYLALDVVDSATGEMIRTGKIDELPVAMRERLAARGHLTRRGKSSELDDAELLGRISSKLRDAVSVSPIVMPTYNCNFRCPYCFERHRLTRGEDWLGRTMTPEMIRAIFASLQKYRDRGYLVSHMTLYGGEPLLKENIEIVRDILNCARSMELTVDCITNGYDLDSYIGLLEGFTPIRLQVTVDGVGEINDRRRLHRNGVPTYDRIMKNIALALEHGIDISLRVNVNRDNIGCIKALTEDLVARGFMEFSGEECHEKEKKENAPGTEKRKGSFGYYFKAVTESEESPSHVTERQVLDAIMDGGCEPMEAIRRQGQYGILAKGIQQLMKMEEYPFFTAAYCGAEGGMAVIDPYGQIFSCWDAVAMEDEAVGVVDIETGSIVYGFNKAKWRTRTSNRMEPCRTCPLIFICRGGCAAMAKSLNGSYFREYCGEIKEIAEYVIPRVAGRKWEKTQEDMLSVSLLTPVSRLTDEERTVIMTARGQKKIFEILKEAEFTLSCKDEKSDESV